MTTKKIPFEVDISRVIDLLAHQIYQSPFALLRENTQNAFDAVLMRAAKEKYNPEVHIDISPSEIVVRDNGIGMNAEELERNYWHAGSSGKNNPEARNAGVVGTFGIGAMANFGIADRLEVVTESALDHTRTRSEVQRERLSATEECITIERLEPSNQPGTTVTASIEPESSVSVNDAEEYIAQFVEFVSVPVFVNGVLRSQRKLTSILPSERHGWEKSRRNVNLGGIATADLKVFGLATGEIRVVIDPLKVAPPAPPGGKAVLIQGGSAIRTLRSGFGLATVSVPSLYSFGGAIDLTALQPTAGREALEGTSNELLVRLVAAIDDVVSEMAASRREVFENQSFLQWIVRHGRFELCGKLQVRLEPGAQERRLGVATGTEGAKFYAGVDNSLISVYASDEAPLIVVSRRSPRRECELGFLRLNHIPEVSDEPQVLEVIDMKELSVAHGAVAFRIARVLVDDYFVEVEVGFARMSHDIPVMLDKESSPIRLLLDPEGGGLAPILQLYETDYDAFGPFVKDFVRGQVFPKVSDLVPSSTREGAEAFLRRLKSKRELFEIAWTDRQDLESIWEKYAEGELSLAEAARLSAVAPRRSIVEVGQGQTGSLQSVLPTLENAPPEDESEGEAYAPLPPVDRREVDTEALVLTGEQPYNGYTCFLAISERTRQQNGEFFLQPHTTSIVWGGQKLLFVFQHHSGEFGLYYDVQCPGLVAEVSGGGPFETSTLVLGNRVFIPVPSEVAHNVIPRVDEVVRLEVKSDILYLETADRPSLVNVQP